MTGRITGATLRSQVAGSSLERLGRPPLRGGGHLPVNWQALLLLLLSLPSFSAAPFSWQAGAECWTAGRGESHPQHPGQQGCDAGLLPPSTWCVGISEDESQGGLMTNHCNESSWSTEISRYMLEFQGSAFPLSALGSYEEGGGGRRRGRDTGKLRRSNTSPRKKQGPSLKWSGGGSFRESRTVLKC